MPRPELVTPPAPNASSSLPVPLSHLHGFTLCSLLPIHAWLGAVDSMFVRHQHLKAESPAPVGWVLGGGTFGR